MIQNVQPCLRLAFVATLNNHYKPLNSKAIDHLALVTQHRCLKELRVGLEVVEEQRVAFPFRVELTEGLRRVRREHLANEAQSIKLRKFSACRLVGWSLEFPVKTVDDSDAVIREQNHAAHGDEASR